MLNGLDPIIIFSFFKKLTDEEKTKFAKLPVQSFIAKFPFPPIPIYLSESITGLYIDTEDKNIDIETNVDTLGNGGLPGFTQKGINSTVKINMLANENSIGLILLSAMADIILPKVTSQEYSIIYFHKATTILNGLLHSFAVSTDSNTNLLKVSLEIVKTSKGTEAALAKDPKAVGLDGGTAGPVPKGGTSGPSGTGPSGGGATPIGRML